MEEFNKNRYNETFCRLKVNQYHVASSSYKARQKKLKKLMECVANTYKQRLRDALHHDFNKPQLEVDLTEILPFIEEIKHAISNVGFWMKSTKIKTPLTLLGSSSYIHKEPKGVCLIISPWNYPVNLSLCPLVSAVAAGNVVILKPSEHTPHTSQVLAEIIKEVFDDNEVVLVQGDADTAKELLKLPFNHVFFTGSPKIGKLVMEAASKHLASVTLELGGKSPTIIDKTVNIKNVARKVAFGKYMNSGQTCIAPDYLFVEETIRVDFMEELKKALREFYSDQIETSNDYAHIVNEQHASHLKELLKDCTDKGGSVYQMSCSHQNGVLIAPTIVTGVTDEMGLMKEEIFGPILPIKSFTNYDECIDYINDNEKPLALYIFSKDIAVVDYIIENTRAGTTCVNHNLLQYLNVNLPFGGSNNSGMGKAHGIFGFKEFTNERAVLKQHTISAADLLRPPYTDLKQKLINFKIRWL